MLVFSTEGFWAFSFLSCPSAEAQHGDTCGLGSNDITWLCIPVPKQLAA
jgi:hypothetical protein